MIRRISFYFLLLIFPLITLGQTHRIDSLKRKTASAVTDKEQLDGLLSICREVFSLHGDTLCYYANKASRLATALGDEEKQLWASCYWVHGLSATGKRDSAILVADKSIAIAHKKNYNDVLAKIYLSKALCLYKYNEPRDGLGIAFNLLQQNNTAEITAECMNMIGICYGGLSQYSESVKWMKQSVTLADKLLNTLQKYEIYGRAFMGLSIDYMHLYEALHNKKHLDSSLYFALKADSICKKNEILFFYCQSQILQGYYYTYLSQTSKAEVFLKQGIATRKLLGDPAYIASDLSVLGTFYAKTGRPQLGIKSCTEALHLAQKYHLTNVLYILAYNALIQNFEAANDFKQSTILLKKVGALKDSLYYTQGQQEIKRLQNELDIREKNLKIANNQKVMVGIISSIIFLIILIIVLFNYYKKQQQFKLKILQEEEKLKAAQSIKDAEEKERQRIAADLHDNLGVQANAILYTSELLKQENNTNNQLTSNLNDTAKDMLFFLRETLWALKTTDTTATALWLRIVSFISQMKRNYSHISFATSGIAPETIMLPSAKALNILMILQEAVNNAIKHSHADTIDVHTELVDKDWKIFIQDNGKGFNIQEATDKMDSHGLGNMQQRALASQISFTINTKEDEGTSIVLGIPT